MTGRTSARGRGRLTGQSDDARLASRWSLLIGEAKVR